MVILEETISDLQDKVKTLKEDKESLENSVRRLEEQVASMRGIREENKALRTRLQTLENGALAEKPKLPPNLLELCCNESSYRLCSLSTQGTLYQDALLTLRCLVTRSNNVCSLDLTLDNLARSAFTSLTVEFLVSDTGLSLHLEADPPEVLPACQHCSLKAQARSSTPYSVAPIMQLHFLHEDIPHKLLLKLPVPFSRFLTATPISKSELTAQFKRYNSCYNKVSLPLVSEEGLLAKLCLAGALSVSDLDEGLVGVGQGYGLPVLVKTQRQAGRLELSCFSPDPRVREALLALLTTLLQP